MWLFAAGEKSNCSLLKIWTIIRRQVPGQGPPFWGGSVSPTFWEFRKIYKKKFISGPPSFENLTTAPGPCQVLNNSSSKSFEEKEGGQGLFFSRKNKIKSLPLFLEIFTSCCFLYWNFMICGHFSWVKRVKKIGKPKFQCRTLFFLHEWMQKYTRDLAPVFLHCLEK